MQAWVLTLTRSRNFLGLAIMACAVSLNGCAASVQVLVYWANLLVSFPHR